MQFDHKCNIHTTCILRLYLPGGNLGQVYYLYVSTNKKSQLAMPFTKYSTEMNPQRATKIFRNRKNSKF